jgi:hypothetical protein
VPVKRFSSSCALPRITFTMTAGALFMNDSFPKAAQSEECWIEPVKPNNKSAVSYQRRTIVCKPIAES